MAIKLRLPALERTRGQGWPSLRARRREICPQAVHSQVRLSSKKVSVWDSCKDPRPMATGRGHVEHRRTGTLLQPNVESVLRMAGLAVIVIVRLGERVRGLLEQPLPFRPSLRPWLMCRFTRGALRWLHLVSGQVNQMYPFPNSCV